MNNEFPCKECLIKVQCKDPCDKAEGIVIYRERSHSSHCPFCGDRANYGSYEEFCVICHADIKSIKNKTKAMEKIYKGE